MPFTIKVKKGIGMKMDATDNPTFEDWMRRVDHMIYKACGLSSADLPDCMYGDWYQARLRPIRAANKALKGANTDMYF
jgi:hypothetical protein